MEDKTFYITKEVVLKKYYLWLVIVLVLCASLLYSFLKINNLFIMIQEDYSLFIETVVPSVCVLLACILLFWNKSHITFHYEYPPYKHENDDSALICGEYGQIYFRYIQNITVEITKDGPVLIIKHGSWRIEQIIVTTYLYPEDYGLSVEEILKYFPDYVPISYK